MPGKIAQVIGTVVDVEFPADQLPNLFDALDVDNSGERLVLEVQQHIGNHWVRCLALGTTDGLARGTEVTDTGAKVSVPVGPETRPPVRRYRYAAGQSWRRGSGPDLAHPPRPTGLRRPEFHRGDSGNRYQGV